MHGSNKKNHLPVNWLTHLSGALIFVLKLSNKFAIDDHNEESNLYMLAAWLLNWSSKYKTVPSVVNKVKKFLRNYA